MDGLGRVFNVLPVADDVYVSLRDADAVSFVCVLTTGDTYTLTEAQDTAGTGAAALVTMTRYHYSATVGSAWVAATQAAASTIVTTSAQDVMVVTVHGDELSDGFSAVKLASTSTGTVVAVLHDLKVRRTPANLPALV